MNYNFTDRVRKVLALAREEAIRMQHDYVGTEHLLLGLLSEGQGVAMAVLQRADIIAAEVRDRINDSVRQGKSTIALGELPYTSRSKKVLEYAMGAAKHFDHKYVGTEHLLIGLLKEEKGIAAQVLNSLGLTLRQAVTLVTDVLGEAPENRGKRDVAWDQEAAGVPFRFQIDDKAEQSIYEQIIAQVQEGVATGALKPGDRIPAVRQLADQLDIAPGTVARAYSELESRGVVITEGARGTRIANPVRNARKQTDHSETLTGLMRPVAVAAFHLGATADGLRAALERAMKGIFEPTDPGAQP
ncbi:MAG: Clp protease N-terminal domain-containing protein [Gemmatimonadota bacterium]